MRIVVIGQAPFGAKVLETLMERGEEVVGVFAPPERRGRPDPLAEAAQEKGVELFQVTSMKTDEVYETFQRLEPDLGIMAFVTLIVPERVLNSPKLGTIQYHPSLLPKHRGASAINWAIINGETRTGLTIFWPDKGLDTGPILLQKEVDIAPDDTVGSLYFNHLFPMGIDALMESVELIKEGKAPRIPQDESQATYEGICKAEDGVIDWGKPAQEVYNLIRGTNPQPGASTQFKGQTLKLFDSELKAGDG
ncbi:MAG: methionyl-tRNA formyltransferase, partial [Dehalococcoidia bacterium]